MRFKLLLYSISGIVLITGIFASIFLSQNRQDNRSRASTATQSLSFRESNVQARVNDNISLNIVLNSGSFVLGEAQIEITFDPTILSPADNGFSVKSPFTIISGPDMSSGKIIVRVQSSDNMPINNAEIAVLTFKALSLTSSPTSVGFGTGSHLTVNGEDRAISNLMPVNVALDSQVLPTPTAQPTVQVTPTVTPMPSVSLYVIRGLVYEDTNRNGAKDSDERIFDASAVNILGGPNNVVSGTVLTKSDGGFQFDNLPSGTYVIRATAPKNFTATTPVSSSLVLPDQNNYLQFGFASLTTSYFLERFPWSNVSVPNFNPYKLYVLLRYRSGYSADVVREQARYEYRWSSSDESIASIAPFSECTNGIVLPCPNDHLTVTGHKAGPVIIRLSVIDSETNLEVANNYFVVTIKEPGPTATPKVSTPSFPLNVYFHGIGNSGDRISTISANSNRDPKQKARNITLELYDSQNNLVNKSGGIISYSSNSGSFQGVVNVTTPIQPGSYVVKAFVQQYLRKNLYDILVLPSNGQIMTRSITFVAGDLNSDNKINILDYNILMPCYSDVLEAQSCSPENKKLADLNDDGKVNFIDYNLFLREYSEQAGE